MPSNGSNGILHWIERGASALFFSLLLAAPQYGGVTGIWWVQLPVIGAACLGLWIIWFTDLIVGNRKLRLWITGFVLTFVALWDTTILLARQADQRTHVVPQVKTAELSVPTADSGREAFLVKPPPVGPQLQKPQLPPSIEGKWRGRVNCGWRFDDLRWTISSSAAGEWRVIEFFHTGTLGITNTQPITYQARWHGNKVHLVADRNQGSYEINLTEADDGQTLSGHYSLHGNCDDVVVRRDDE